MAVPGGLGAACILMHVEWSGLWVDDVLKLFAGGCWSRRMSWEHAASKHMSLLRNVVNAKVVYAHLEGLFELRLLDLPSFARNGMENGLMD